LDFWICETRSEWNSFDRRIASREGLPHHSIQVECQTFGWVLERYGIPYYLKIDIEGHDESCIQALCTRNDLPKYASVELSANYESLVGGLEKNGYTGFKCISQYNFWPLQLPPDPEVIRHRMGSRILMSQGLLARSVCKAIGRQRLARRVFRSRTQGDWVFADGSSGPFGEDTLGEWLTAERLRDSLRHYGRLFEQRQAQPFWRMSDFSRDSDPLSGIWADLHVRRL
jgi:hypothetical protein